MQAHLKRACMWTREHVYVIARVGVKNDWVSVCLCIHPSVRFSIGMYLNIYVRMSDHSFVFKPMCLNISVRL